MTITVTSLRHSIHPNPEGPDLITVLARYPRFIHPELMTYRVFSRNASSSRAVPVMRLIRDVLDDPAVPVEWGSNRPGMQAGEALTGWRLWLVRTAWFTAMYVAVAMAWVAAKAGAHKQVVNRIIEPWSHITVVISSTEWQNFFDQRCHPDADPTMRVLAEEIRAAINRNPFWRRIRVGEWHTPFSKDGDLVEDVACCARTSYLNHDGVKSSREKDAALFDMLNRKRHLSPFEHQATPVNDHSGSGNFGPWWRQLRQEIE